MNKDLYTKFITCPKKYLLKEPAVNTDVRKHRAWIDTIIGKHEEVGDLVSSPPKSRYFKAKHLTFQGFPGEARHA